jgi:hypothetical protein
MLCHWCQTPLRLILIPQNQWFRQLIHGARDTATRLYFAFMLHSLGSRLYIINCQGVDEVVKGPLAYWGTVSWSMAGNGTFVA